jgi:hypothetical protein
MLRILDIDIDFFVTEIAYHCDPDGPRLDPNEYPPWDLNLAVRFIEERCLLSQEHPLPGVCVENHGELFWIWRELLELGKLTSPFDLTHVDAHADVGLGDAGYVYIVEELMHLPPEQRNNPNSGFSGLNDGNFLAFACACRWISNFTYVQHPDSDGNDFIACHMKNFDPRADALRFVALEKSHVLNTFFDPEMVTPVVSDPLIPVRRFLHHEYTTEAPFDFVFVSRTPAFTPPECDDLFELIKDRYVRAM